tara:strand:- start:1278 stop:1526 length:249 start_codon:yes stop_codon:yes gene_type:complete
MIGVKMNQKEIKKKIKEQTKFIEKPSYKSQAEISYAQGYRKALCDLLGEKEPPAIKFDMDGIIKRALIKLEKQCNFGLRIKE